jgi:hypothetical protein
MVFILLLILYSLPLQARQPAFCLKISQDQPFLFSNPPCFPFSPFSLPSQTLMIVVAEGVFIVVPATTPATTVGVC